MMWTVQVTLPSARNDVDCTGDSPFCKEWHGLYRWLSLLQGMIWAVQVTLPSARNDVGCTGDSLLQGMTWTVQVTLPSARTNTEWDVTLPSARKWSGLYRWLSLLPWLCLLQGSGPGCTGDSPFCKKWSGLCRWFSLLQGLIRSEMWLSLLQGHTEWEWSNIPSVRMAGKKLVQQHSIHFGCFCCKK